MEFCHPVLAFASTGWRTKASKVLNWGDDCMEAEGFSPRLLPQKLGYPVLAAPSERRRLNALRRRGARSHLARRLVRRWARARGTRGTEMSSPPKLSQTAGAHSLQAGTPTRARGAYALMQRWSVRFQKWSCLLLLLLYPSPYFSFFACEFRCP